LLIIKNNGISGEANAGELGWTPTCGRITILFFILYFNKLANGNLHFQLYEKFN
jgi:hypothetical protein